MATVYIETSIFGYLTARSREAVIFQARQQLTQQWWADQRSKYELVTSQLVIDEAGAGDPAAAQERLVLLDDLPLLDIQHPDVRPLPLENRPASPSFFCSVPDSGVRQLTLHIRQR